MAIITYASGNKTLKGTAGADVFAIDLALLGTGRTRLTDLGGADTLRIVDSTGVWATKAFVNTGETLIWKGSAGGRIVIPLSGANPQVEFLEWSLGTGAAPVRLRLTTDLTPDSGGNIAIIGTSGNNQIIVPDKGASSAGRSEVHARGGADTVTASSVELTVVYGGRGADLIVTPGPAAAEFYGGHGADILLGCGGADTLVGNKGKDSLNGAAGADILKGGGGGDTLVGGDGRDVLAGGSGKDTLRGEAGNDDLSGGGWNDLLFGGAGADTLNGGKGRDTLSGGQGADIFAFKGTQDEGTDHITDFQDGVDVLQIKGGSFADLSISQSGDDTRITLSGGSVIVLQGLDPSLISAADFEFV